LFILPLVFGWGMKKTGTASVSLEPEDEASQHYLAAAGLPHWE
jgi:hypothetical protein